MRGTLALLTASPMLHILLFCILFTSAVSVLFLPSASQAGWFSSEKTPEEMAKEYGEAITITVSINEVVPDAERMA